MENGVKKISMNQKVVRRRQSALLRLEEQLSSKGVKDPETGELIPFAESQVKRITKEIATLKARI